MKITLVRPAICHKQDALAFRQEFFDSGENIINGSELLDKTERYEDWLTAVTRNTSPDTVSPDWVLTDTFFAIDDNERIVGIIDLRRELKGFLTDFGNSGYSVRPSERGRGYAAEMLHQLTLHASQVGMEELHLSVERGNAPSVRTILKNGGVYERSFDCDGEQADVYRIALTKSE